MNRLSVKTFGLILLLASSFAQAAGYRFRPIVIPQTPPENFIEINTFTSSKAGVAYMVRTATNPSAYSIYLWANGETTLLASTGAGIGQFSDISLSKINDAGQIAVSARLVGETFFSAYRISDGNWERIYNGQTHQRDGYASSINNFGHISITVLNPIQVLKWRDGQFFEITPLGIGGNEELGEVTNLSDDGYVYVGVDASGVSPAIYRVQEDGSYTAIRAMDEVNQFFDVNRISDVVTAGFMPSLVRVRSNLEVEVVSDYTDGFSSFYGGYPRTNNRRDVVFRGFHEDETQGIYLWRGHQLKTIIENGDLIGANAVDSVYYPQVDNSGRIAFRGYVPATQTDGLYVAIPKGDFDADGDIDVVDYDSFALCYSGSMEEPMYVPPSQECAEAFDFDEDTDVDLGDYDSLNAALVGPCSTNASILSHPVSQSVSTGASVTFSVTAEGVGELAYQWKHFGSPIPGATSATLHLNSVTHLDAGLYTVAVNDGCFPVETSATLTVDGGQVFTWLEADAVWGDTGHWSPTGFPSTPEDIAVIDNGGLCHVEADHSLGSLQGTFGELTFDAQLNTLSFSEFDVGLDGRSFQLISLAGGRLSGDMRIGPGGRVEAAQDLLQHNSGVLTVRSGGLLTVTGAESTFLTSPNGFRIKKDGDDPAVVEVQGGGYLSLRSLECDGTIRITDGVMGSGSNGGLNVGYDGDCEVIVDGPNARMSLSTVVWVGQNETSHGQIRILNGGTYQHTNIPMGIGAFGQGSLLVDGVGSTMKCTAGFFVGGAGGFGGSGEVNVTNGGLLDLQDSQLGVGEHGLGKVIIDGTGSQLRQTNRHMFIGANADGAGEIIVQSGGKFTRTGTADMTIGYASIGTLTIQGAGSTANVTLGGDSRLRMGDYEGSQGTIRVLDGGNLMLTGNNEQMLVGINGSGHLIVDGSGSSFFNLSFVKMIDGSISVSNGGLFTQGRNLVADAGQITATGLGSRLHCGGINWTVNATFTVSDGAEVMGGAILVLNNSLTVTDSSFRTYSATNNSTATIVNSAVQFTGPFTNNGVLQIDNSTFESTSHHVGPNGYLLDMGGAGSHIALNENFVIQSTQAAMWNTDATNVQFKGVGGGTQTLEAASRDLGATMSGFESNVAFGSIRVGPTATTVMIKDDYDNAMGLEAVYVGSLILESGTTLNLNGQTVYYQSLVNKGGAIVANGGQLLQVIP